MDSIDPAYQQLLVLLEDVGKYSETIFTEQDVRIKVIDRMLIDVLGWQYADIQTEEHAGKGFLDYKLSHDGLARVIIEAKRDGRELGVASREAAHGYKLNGPVFSSPDAKEGIEQAIYYSGHKNAELACVTNGREWIVFRSNRLGDGKDTVNGIAFVFPSLEAVQKEFKKFYDLLAYSAVQKLVFRAYFQEAEGLPIRNVAFQRCLRNPDTHIVLKRSAAAMDLDKVMTSFFQRLTAEDDTEMLDKCFVVTPESIAAENKLIRLSEEFVTTVRGMNTETGEQLTDLLRRVKTQHTNQFVLLVGTKGAGKSTFIDRFFRLVLPPDVAESCVLVKVNLADSEGDENGIVTWLNDHLLAETERAVYSDRPPTWDEIIGSMFFDEYQRWSTGSMSHLYEADKQQFKIKFGEHVETIRKEKPQEFIRRLLADLIKSRKKIPCLVFDNADHFSIEFQERVFQYARAIYETELCLILIPVTDRTSWQLSRQGALHSFESESLFLPTPLPRLILERRVKFLADKLATESTKQAEDYFIGRGLRLNIANLSSFAAGLQKIFVESGDVSKWIGGFANHDVRRVLELARDIVASPQIDLEEVLKAHIVKSAIVVPPHKIKKAIICGKYDIYPAGQHKFVHNIFAMHLEIPTSPLLGVRILQLLRDSKFKGDHEERTFLPVDQVYEYFRAMGFERRVVSCWLDAMLRTALCWNYDPTVNDISKATRLELSPSGNEHLIWATNDPDFMHAMMYVTPLTSRDVFDALRHLGEEPFHLVWRRLVATFIEYLVEEDAVFCSIPEHEAYKGQLAVTRRLDWMKHRITNPPRSSRFGSGRLQSR